MEGSTGPVLLVKMADALAATAASEPASFFAKLNLITAPMRQSFTHDQSKEMSRHKELAVRTSVKVFFCGPHSSWQSGTCENINGLLRQHFLEGSGLHVHTQDQLDAVADSLSIRPHARHKFDTPLAVFAHLLATAQQTPAKIY